MAKIGKQTNKQKLEILIASKDEEQQKLSFTAGRSENEK